ncbi:hypothetical protein BDV18DRAFT_158728 [Aspergillus unguis]
MQRQTSRAACPTCKAYYEDSLITLLTNPAAYDPVATTICPACNRADFVNPLLKKNSTLSKKVDEIRTALEIFDADCAAENEPLPSHEEIATAPKIMLNGVPVPDISPFRTRAPIIEEHPITLRRTFSGQVGDIAMGIYETEDGEVDIGTGYVVEMTESLVLIDRDMFSEELAVNCAVKEDAAAVRAAHERRRCVSPRPFENQSDADDDSFGGEGTVSLEAAAQLLCPGLTEKNRALDELDDGYLAGDEREKKGR